MTDPDPLDPSAPLAAALDALRDLIDLAIDENARDGHVPLTLAADIRRAAATVDHRAFEAWAHGG